MRVKCEVVQPCVFLSGGWVFPVVVFFGSLLAVFTVWSFQRD